MNFWKRFNNNTEAKNANLNTIYENLKTHFENTNEEELAKIAAICSMMARVSNSDLNICKSEEKKMSLALKTWFKMTNDDSLKIVDMVVKYTKELSGIENHLYARQLNLVLKREQKENLLKTLFAVAAADGVVSSIEENEIYNITKEIHLTRKEYVAAKMTVLEYLGALKI